MRGLEFPHSLPARLAFEDVPIFMDPGHFITQDSTIDILFTDQAATLYYSSKVYCMKVSFFKLDISKIMYSCTVS